MEMNEHLNIKARKRSEKNDRLDKKLMNQDGL